MTIKISLLGNLGTGKSTIKSMLFSSPKPSQSSEESKLNDSLEDLAVNIYEFGSIKTPSLCDSHLVFLFHPDAKTWERDFLIMASLLQNTLLERNQNLMIFLHKIDQIEMSKREKVFEEFKILLNSRICSKFQFKFEVYLTSIWDDSLYKAFSRIMQEVFPNTNLLKDLVLQVGKQMDCDEIVVFHKPTMLMIHSYGPIVDFAKYEHISVLIKMFKVNKWGLNANMNSLCIKNRNAQVSIIELSDTLYLYTSVTDPRIEPFALDLSMKSVKSYYKRMLKAKSV